MTASVKSSSTIGGVSSNGTPDAFRIPDTYKLQAAVDISQVEAIWTPASGKQPRLMGGWISLSVADVIVFYDDNGAIFRTPKLAANTPTPFDTGGNGIPAVGHVKAGALNGSGVLDGTIWGIEE